jgi:Fungal specific transcription factor domain/Fungal Zn(2)-Cys(6) binuclear cluster domain
MTPKRVRTVEGSCWACKDRRVICDLQRPQCSRCVAEDQPCEYGKLRLRWCNGVAARGRFAGQNMPVSSISEPQQQQIQRGEYQRLLLDGQTASSLSPSLTQEEEPLDDRDGISDQSLSISSSSSSPAPLEYSYSFDTIGVSSIVTAEHLMLYFEHIIVDRFNLSSKPVLVDLASVYKHPALRYSITAVANAHQQLSYCPGRRDVFLSKRTTRLKAIHNFRTQLQSPYHQQLLVSRRFLPLDLFIANVLLCILDGVIDPHDESAATHVHYRGGRAILSQWKLPQHQLQRQKRGLPALMVSCFATMDLTYSLLTGEEQYFQHTAWAHFAGSDGWWGVLPDGDPFLDIMRILSRLAQLGHLAREAPEAAAAASFAGSEEVETLSMALQGYSSSLALMQNEETPFIITSGDAPLSADLLSPMYSTDSAFDHARSWTIFCNAYRLAGLIYIYRVFHHLDATHELVQQATNLGLRAICESRLKGKLAHCLLFPALVIGAHCRTGTQQAAVLGAMRSTAAFLQFGSMRVMENFLQGLWARYSLGFEAEMNSESGSVYGSLEPESWWECFEPISKKTFLF